MEIIHGRAECGCEYEELKIDGEIVLCGDYYHDKISEAIEGFLDGLEFGRPETKSDIENKKLITIKCGHGCDD